MFYIEYFFIHIFSKFKGIFTTNEIAAMFSEAKPYSKKEIRFLYKSTALVVFVIILYLIKPFRIFYVHIISAFMILKAWQYFYMGYVIRWRIKNRKEDENNSKIIDFYNDTFMLFVIVFFSGLVSGELIINSTDQTEIIPNHFLSTESNGYYGKVILYLDRYIIFKNSKTKSFVIVPTDKVVKIEEIKQTKPQTTKTAKKKKPIKTQIMKHKNTP